MNDRFRRKQAIFVPCLGHVTVNAMLSHLFCSSASTCGSQVCSAFSGLCPRLAGASASHRFFEWQNELDSRWTSARC